MSKPRANSFNTSQRKNASASSHVSESRAIPRNPLRKQATSLICREPKLVGESRFENQRTMEDMLTPRLEAAARLHPPIQAHTPRRAESCRLGCCKWCARQTKFQCMAPESPRFGGSCDFGMLHAILRAAARQPGAGATGRDPEYDESGLQVCLAGPCRGSVIRAI